MLYNNWTFVYFVYLIWIWKICGDFVDFTQFYKEEIHGNLLKHFSTKSRRFRESVKEENFVSLSTQIGLR